MKQVDSDRGTQRRGRHNGLTANNGNSAVIHVFKNLGAAVMTSEQSSEITILVTEEKLDALVASKFKDAVKKLASEGNSRILIDMGNTRFVDSAGCGALVASLRVLLRNNGDMKIARPSPQARTLFELTRLHRVFEIFDDVESAQSSFL